MATTPSKNTQAKVMVLVDSAYTAVDAGNPLQVSTTTPAVSGDSVQAASSNTQAIPIQLIDANGNVTGIASNPIDVDLV